MCHHGKHHHGHHRGQGCDCKEKRSESHCRCGEGCCESGGHFHRRYQTKAEQITDLESYLGELKLEVQSVEERLADLRA